NTEFLKFVLNIITPNSFIKGRRELALRFLNHFNDHELKKFIEFYLNLKEKDRKIIDILIRNYERFSRLSINLSLKFENYIFIKKISDSLNLNFNSMILSLYYFSKWERVKLRRILLNLILILNKKEIKFS
ncbi:MAG: hypothetical protein N3D74_06525, partial [Caldisericia bacterium]|nr:hypothetical protein [Caldisericia bacterium]